MLGTRTLKKHVTLRIKAAMLGFQMTASGRVPYPSKSSNLCRASRTISSVTSGLRMSLICSGKKSNISTRNQQLLLHSVGRQRSLIHGSDQQGV